MYYDYDYNLFQNKTYSEATAMGKNETKPNLRKCKHPILSSSEKYTTAEKKVLYSNLQ